MKAPFDEAPIDDGEAEIWDAEDYSGEDDKQGSGPYATLHLEGPQTSTGSIGHPEQCMPCTFYCFTRRGCNRGLECRFCHLTHQSKLQQRREAWKKQQREKRKSIRERVAAESSVRRPSKGQLESITAVQTISTGAAVAKTLFSLSGSAERQMCLAPVKDVMGMVPFVFAYSPSRAILTIGQDAEFRPQIAAAALRFRLTAPLPQGLVLDPVSGVVSGSPATAAPQCAVVIEAELLGGRTVRAALELEVVDFTRGGFVIGHISEFEPGKFMLLLYVPDEQDGGSEKGYPWHFESAAAGGKGGAVTNGRPLVRGNQNSVVEQKQLYQHSAWLP